MVGVVFFFERAEPLHVYLVYYLVLRVIYLMVITSYTLRAYWVWVNPKLR
jgi:hypothetical protein